MNTAYSVVSAKIAEKFTSKPSLRAEHTERLSLIVTDLKQKHAPLFDMRGTNIKKPAIEI